jgi:hypothetical protein
MTGLRVRLGGSLAATIPGLTDVTDFFIVCSKKRLDVPKSSRRKSIYAQELRTVNECTDVRNICSC